MQFLAIIVVFLTFFCKESKLDSSSMGILSLVVHQCAPTCIESRFVDAIKHCSSLCFACG